MATEAINVIEFRDPTIRSAKQRALSKQYVYRFGRDGVPSFTKDPMQALRYRYADGAKYTARHYVGCKAVVYRVESDAIA